MPQQVEHCHCAGTVDADPAATGNAGAATGFGVWMPCAEAWPACVPRDAAPGSDPAAVEPSEPALYSAMVLVTVDMAGPQRVAIDRIVRLEAGDDAWWERFGPRVTHWMPLPAPAPGTGGADR